MKSHEKCSSGIEGVSVSAVSDAIRAWHRGDKLTESQSSLIEQARVITLGRAYGISL